MNLTILVLKELWEVEELRDQLLDVVGVVHEGLPRCWDRVELAVSTIKPEQRKEGTSKLIKRYDANTYMLRGQSFLHWQRLAVPYRPLCSWMCREVKGSTLIR